MSRALPACLTVGLLLVLIGLDYAASPPDPYRAPAMIALGSGAASAGGFCGALPD